MNDETVHGFLIGKRSSGVGMADSLMPRAVASIFVPRVQRDCRMTCSRGQRVAAVRLTRASNEASSKLHLKIVSKSSVFWTNFYIVRLKLVLFPR